MYTSDTTNFNNSNKIIDIVLYLQIQSGKSKPGVRETTRRRHGATEGYVQLNSKTIHDRLQRDMEHRTANVLHN